MSDRIKLSEAMGWTRERRKTGHSESWLWFNPDGDTFFDPPNPFKSANDDYAVLEWMREQWDTDLIDAALEHTGLGHKWAYSIGDYAEAAQVILDGNIAACHKGGCEQFDAEDTVVNREKSDVE